jgi:hypothetical protein
MSGAAAPDVACPHAAKVVPDRRKGVIKSGLGSGPAEPG